MSNAIELYSKFQDPMDAIAKMGEWFAKSGMFKSRNVEQGQMLAFIAVAERKSPIELLRENHIMNDGTLAPRSRNVHARFLERGGDVEWIKTGEEDVEFEKLYAEAIIRFNKREHRVRFSIADARKKQLQVDKEDSVWRKSTGNMLRARVLTKGIDLFCPDIVLGVPDDDGVPQQETAPAIKLEPKPVNSPPQQPETKTERKTEARVVEAEIVTAPQPAKAPAAPAASSDELPADILSKVEEAIGENGVAALRWLRGNGKLKEGQGLQCLSQKMAESIIKRPAEFIRAVMTWNANQPKA